MSRFARKAAGAQEVESYLSDDLTKLLLEDIFAKCKFPKYNVLLLDEVSDSIVSSVLGPEDFATHRISMVERLRSKEERAPFPSQHAIYILTPTKNNVDLLMEDFASAESPMYAFAHVFWLSRLPEGLFQEIRAHPVFLSRCRTFTESNFEVKPKFNNVFTTTPTYSMKDFYENPALSDKEFTMARQIASLFGKLGDCPTVFASEKAVRFSKSVQNYLTEMDLPSYSARSGLCTSLIVLERGYDLAAAVQHSFSFYGLLSDSTDLNLFNGAVSVPNIDNESKSSITNLYASKPFRSVAHLNIDSVGQQLKAFLPASTTKGRSSARSPGALANAISSLGANDSKVREMYGLFTLLARVRDSIATESELAKLIQIEEGIAQGRYQTVEKVLDDALSVLNQCPTEAHIRFILYLSNYFDLDRSTITEISSALGFRGDLVSSIDSFKKLNNRPTPTPPNNNRRRPTRGTTSMLSAQIISKLAQGQNVDLYQVYRPKNSETRRSGKPTIVLYVLGGISPHEVAAIQALNFPRANVVVGSSSIIGSDQMIEDILSTSAAYF
ncbi:hypothetical protein PCE1_004449 [Barthelona sp. PCE]